MKANRLTRSAGAAQRSAALASLALASGATVSAAVITFDFENVPSDFQYNGAGLNLGVYYSGQPNAPVFGPDAEILDGTACSRQSPALRSCSRRPKTGLR